MKARLKIKRGDQVRVLTGAYRRTEGKVLTVLPSESRVIVEGVNLIKRHTKPNAKYPKGGIIEREASIHVSNVMLIEPSTGKPTRVGRRRNEDGKLVRYSKKSGKEIQ